LTKKLKM